jgi:hypothetical protein
LGIPERFQIVDLDTDLPQRVSGMLFIAVISACTCEINSGAEIVDREKLNRPPAPLNGRVERI